MIFLGILPLQVYNIELLRRCYSQGNSRGAHLELLYLNRVFHRLENLFISPTQGSAFSLYRILDQLNGHASYFSSPSVPTVEAKHSALEVRNRTLALRHRRLMCASIKNYDFKIKRTEMAIGIERSP